MDAKDLFLQIAKNEQNFGQCDADTAANVINNEESLDKPATYFMYEPKETNPNGSIAVSQTRDMLKTGSYDGAGATLANARLYAFYNPIRKELFEKEQEYKKLVFEDSNFFSRFGNDYMRNWYSLKQNEARYKMSKAQQDGDYASALDYKFQMEDIQKQLDKYVQPDEGFTNSTANVVASMARNAPELLAVSIGAAAVTYATGGTGTAAFLSSAGSTVLNGSIIYNDTFKLEAGEMLDRLEMDPDANDMTLDQKIQAAESYARPAALIEASGALFGLTKMGTSAVYKGALSLTEKGAAKIATKGLKKLGEEKAKKEMLAEFAKMGILQRFKDPKYVAYVGKKIGEHLVAATGEGAQEVTQEMLQDAWYTAVKSGQDLNNAPIMENIFKTIADGSESSKYAQLFLNTFAASLFISGTGATVSGVTQTGYQKLVARSMKNMNSDELGQRIIDLKKNSQAYSKSRKAYNESTNEIKNVGNAPETAVLNAGHMATVFDEAEKKGDTSVLQKLSELGITRDKVENAVKGTGQLKVDFAQFDDVVLDPNDTSLFQKVKGQYTFDETTLTKREMEVLLGEIAEKRPELSKAMEDKESIFNITLRGLMQNENFTHKMAVYNAALAQTRINRIMTFRGNKAKPISFDILNRSQSDLNGTGLFQKVFHGGKEIVGRKFKLEFVGKQNGKAHGYGVYTTKDRSAATGYKEAAKGKLYEVDIPENDFLIDEQKKYSDQPEAVKAAFDRIFKNMPDDYKTKKYLLNNYKNMTGKNLYLYASELAYFKKNKTVKGFMDRNSGGDALGSEMLDKEGVKGITYDDVNTGRSFVVFNPEEAKITDELYQKQADLIAGVFSKEFGKYIIKLTEAANPTTFQHEFSHLTMYEMLDAYNSGEMTDYWRKKTEVIADFSGFKKEKNGRYILDSDNPTTKKQITEAHEKFADAFSTYLKEGKAPVESLNDLFAAIRDWFVDVYQKLRLSDVKLNKSIRNAFDALLVEKEEMDQTIIEKNVRGIGRRSWVSEDEYQQYLSDLAALNRVSTSKHIEAIRKRNKIALEEKNKQKLAEIRADVDAQVSLDPRYKLVDDIRARKINSFDIPADLKVKNPMLYLSKEGLPVEQFITDHADVVSNVADVVELLNNLESKQEVVERNAQEQFDAWLKEEYPELVEVEAKVASANNDLIKVRLKEYMMLNKIPLVQFNQYYNELVRASNAEIESMKLRELTNVERLLDLETKIVTKARFAKSDTELANSLWHQAVVDYIIMRAKDIRVQVNRFNRYFDKYKYAPTTSVLKRIDAYDFDMVQSILRNIGFTKKKPRIRDVALSTRITDWITNKMQTSFSDANEVRPFIPSLTQETGVKFDNNTYHDFAVYDVLTRLIEGISRSDKELTETNKQELRQTDVNSVIEFQQGKNIKASMMNWWIDQVVMKEQFLKKIFPRKIFNEYVLPFIDAMTLREQRISKNDSTAAPVLEHIAKNRKQTFTVPLASGNVINMTYEEMQVAVFNIDNMETWVDSWNAQKGAELTMDDFLSIIEQAPQQMIDDAKIMWGIFESQKAEFREAQYKINGFLMDYVEPRSITLSDGRTIQSGYFPRGQMPKTQGEFANTISSFQNNGVYVMATSKFAKDRKENGRHSSLDLSTNSLRSWLYHTATVIEIGPKFTKLSKMINDDSLSGFMGKEVTRSLNDWMSYSIVGDNLNKFFATLDKISSVQILGWEPIRAAVQAFGWIPSMSTIGPQWIAPQLLKMSTWTSLGYVGHAAELSPYMKERYENAVNHIAGMSESNQLIRTGKTLADKIMNVAMWFTAHGDAFASYIVWNAAHEKAIAEGYSEGDAVLMADSAVRTSQGDSTAVSRPKILQKDTRFLTKFATYFIAMNSRISSAIVGKDRAELVAIAMLSGIIAPTVEAYIRSLYEWAIGSDDDKKKWRKNDINSLEDLAFYNMKTNILSSVGQTTLPIAGFGGYVGNLLATGSAFDKPLPMIDYLYSLGKAFSYPILAAGAETEREKEKYVKGFKKSALKSLTIPNKLVKMVTE